MFSWIKIMVLIIFMSLSYFSQAMISTQILDSEISQNPELLKFYQIHDISDATVVNKIFNVQVMAKIIVKNASENFRNIEQKKLAINLLRQFSTIQLHYRPKGKEDAFCQTDPTLKAGVYQVFGITFDDIWICPSFFESGYNLEEQAQILIHEYIHTLNYIDECETTNIEWQIMIASGQGVRLNSAHAQRCFKNSF